MSGPLLTGEAQDTAIKVAEALDTVLDTMNRSGVSALEIQRTDPDTPYELVSRALKAVLGLVSGDPERLYEMSYLDRTSVRRALTALEHEQEQALNDEVQYTVQEWRDALDSAGVYYYEPEDCLNNHGPLAQFLANEMTEDTVGNNEGVLWAAIDVLKESGREEFSPETFHTVVLAARDTVPVTFDRAKWDLS